MSRGEEEKRLVWVRDWTVGQISQAIKTLSNDKAIFMAEDWLEVNKPTSAFLVVLGKIYLRNGHLEKAEAVARKAHELNPLDMATEYLLNQCQRARSESN